MQQSFYGFRELGSGSLQSFALELVPSGKCQLRCSNCYQGGGRLSGMNGERARSRFGAWAVSSKHDMHTRFVREAILQAKDCGFSEIVFIGGEPTLHRDLPSFVEFTLNLGMSPILVSNGVRMANKQYSDRVILPGTTVVLHAPLPAEVQARQCGVPQYATKLMQAYENVLGRDRVTVVAESVILDSLIDYLPDTLRWCEQMDVVPFIEITRRSDSGQRFKGVPEPEEVEALFQRLAEVSLRAPSVLLPPAFDKPCTMAITGLHVKNRGRGDYGGVYSCCAQHIRHGDLRYDSLADILARPSLRVFQDQDEWIAGPCRNCEHYGLCRGGCRGEAFLTFGCPRASCPVCWHIAAEIRQDARQMCPSTCKGCPLEHNQACDLPWNKKFNYCFPFPH